MNLDLSGKTAMVCGSTQGIGKGEREFSVKCIPSGGSKIKRQVKTGSDLWYFDLCSL